MDDVTKRKDGWEREVLERLASASLSEQRSKRRWGVFFKLLGFAYIGAIVFMLGDFGTVGTPGGDRHTAMVDLQGIIEPGGDASAESVMAALRDAFEENNVAGVILRVNSPGGSPVQSSIVNDEIGRLRKKHPDKALHVVVEDVCASGCYFIAAAADKIFVNRASVVGSIGVLMDGFGFTGALEKLGVERRLMTAGENKGFLDPFSPQDPQQRAHVQRLLDDIHQQFIQVVRDGRGDRLKESPDIFSGLMWTGQQSIEIGLVDGFGSVDSVARDVIKAEKVVDYTFRRSFADTLAKRIGASMADSLTAVFRDLRFY